MNNEKNELVNEQAYFPKLQPQIKIHSAHQLFITAALNVTQIWRRSGYISGLQGSQWSFLKLFISAFFLTNDWSSALKGSLNASLLNSNLFLLGLHPPCCSRPQNGTQPLNSSHLIRAVARMWITRYNWSGFDMHSIWHPGLVSLLRDFKCNLNLLGAAFSAPSVPLLGVLAVFQPIAVPVRPCTQVPFWALPSKQVRKAFALVSCKLGVMPSVREGRASSPFLRGLACLLTTFLGLASA